MLGRLFYWLQRAAVPADAVFEIRAGDVRQVRGTSPPILRADFGDVARAFGLATGRLEIVRSAGRRQLRFSPDIPHAAHQRFRNVLGTLP